MGVEGKSCTFIQDTAAPHQRKKGLGNSPRSVYLPCTATSLIQVNKKTALARYLTTESRRNQEYGGELDSQEEASPEAVSYTHLTLPTTTYV